MEVLIEAAKSGNFLLFAVGLIVIFAGVIGYQWVYTQKNTVPKWIYDQEFEKNQKLTGMVEGLIASNNTLIKGVSDLTIIVQERLRK